MSGNWIWLRRRVNETEELRAKNKLEQIQTLEFYYWDGEKLVRSGRPSVVKKPLMDEPSRGWGEGTKDSGLE